MLTIKNTSGGILRLGFIRNGITLLPNESIQVESYYVENNTFKELQNSSKISIIDYDNDYTRFAIREEITGSGGSGEQYATKIINPKETVLRGQYFNYILSPRPTSSIDTELSVNGVTQLEGKDYSVNPLDGTIHWLITADFDISITDDVVVRYTYE